MCGIQFSRSSPPINSAGLPEGKSNMNDCALKMFDLCAKLTMAQEYLVDGTFNVNDSDVHYYGVCRKHLRQHNIPGVDIAGVRTLRQEGLLPDFSFADALELLAQQQVALPFLRQAVSCGASCASSPSC